MNWKLIAAAIAALELLAGGAAMTFVLVHVVVHHDFQVTWPFVAFVTMYAAYHMGRATFRDFLKSKLDKDHE